MHKFFDREFWAHAGELHAAFLQELCGCIPHADEVLPNALRRVFTQSGEREAFEVPYFTKRKGTVALALKALSDLCHGEYLHALRRSIRSTCEEYAWAVPAHCEGVDECTCVDLFASETASMLAEICVLLGDELGDETVTLVRQEIERRVFAPFCRSAYWWENGFNNWTAVCCGNVGIAMMRLAPNLFEEQKPRILRALSRYIDAFPSDGNCPEGLAYWQYGFGHYVWFADVLRAYSHGEIDLLKSEKAEKIASYPQKVFLKGNTTVSIGDSGRFGKADRALLAYLHNKYASCRLLPRERTGNVSTGIGWLSSSRRLLYDEDASGSDVRENYLFEASGLAIVNERAYSLCVKAGHNGESHNHNDVGGFILSDDSGQVFCDLGAGRYFGGYFDDSIRYTRLPCASWGHSVPIIDGKYQQAGKAYGGELSWHGNEIRVDFAAAYDGAASKLVRTFTYGPDGVTMKDEFADAKTVTERFVSVLKPQRIEGGVRVGNVRLLSAACPQIHEDVYETHGFHGKSERVYFTDFTFDGEGTAVFEMRFCGGDAQ